MSHSSNFAQSMALKDFSSFWIILQGCYENSAHTVTRLNFSHQKTHGFWKKYHQNSAQTSNLRQILIATDFIYSKKEPFLNFDKLI